MIIKMILSFFLDEKPKKIIKKPKNQKNNKKKIKLRAPLVVFFRHSGCKGNNKALLCYY